MTQRAGIQKWGPMGSEWGSGRRWASITGRERRDSSVAFFVWNVSSCLPLWSRSQWSQSSARCFKLGTSDWLFSVIYARPLFCVHDDSFLFNTEHELIRCRATLTISFLNTVGIVLHYWIRPLFKSVHKHRLLLSDYFFPPKTFP